MIIDVNFYPVEEAKRSNMRHRPIGLGVQGLADVFLLLARSPRPEPASPADATERATSRQPYQSISPIHKPPNGPARSRSLPGGTACSRTLPNAPAQGLPFDSEEAAQLNKEIFETIYFAALSESCALAEKHGPYETYQVREPVPPARIASTALRETQPA